MISTTTLEGRTAIVTGASRGIGKAIAIGLAEAGADVAVAARTLSDLEATAGEIRALGRKAVAIPTDVSVSEQVDALVERTLEQFGHIEILVNNAAQAVRVPIVPLPDRTVTPPGVTRASTYRMSDEEWHKVLDTNLSSVFYGCRAVGPHMLERRYGKIINITSPYGKYAAPYHASYNASKAALNMVTRVLALEWAEYNICVNAMGPGSTDTDLNIPVWGGDPDLVQRSLDRIPMHRLTDLQDIKSLSVYLASAASDYMTGQIVYVDGGATAQ